MSNLDKHLVNKEQKLNTLELSIRQLQEQLNQINQEIRVEKQLAQAQKSIEKEFNGVKEKLFKLFKDACGCFSIDALDDMGNDLLEMVEQVKSEYDSYAVSDRFLNAETAAIEDDEKVNTLSIPFLSGAEEVLPPEGDNITPLSPIHVGMILDNLPDEVLLKIQALYGISTRMKQRSNVYKAISGLGVTRASLENLISSIPRALPLAG